MTERDVDLIRQFTGTFWEPAEIVQEQFKKLSEHKNKVDETWKAKEGEIGLCVHSLCFRSWVDYRETALKDDKGGGRKHQAGAKAPGEKAEPANGCTNTKI